VVSIRQPYKFRMSGVINCCHVFFSLKFAYLPFIFFSHFLADLKPYPKLWHIFHILSERLLVLLALLDYVVSFATSMIISTRDDVNSHHMLCEHILYCFPVLDRFFHFLLGG